MVRKKNDRLTALVIVGMLV